MDAGQQSEATEWHLDAETEYRFELDPKSSITIKVRQLTPVNSQKPLTPTIASSGHSRGVWCRASSGKDIRLWRGVQGGVVYMDRM